MPIISESVRDFLSQQGFVILSTIDKKGRPHSACKGIVRIGSNDDIYLLDLYKRESFSNLKANPCVSLTMVDEHNFKGFCLKGYAQIVHIAEASKDLLEIWETRITSRIAARLIKNIGADKPLKHHPEASLPAPAYFILVKIDQVVDLAPLKLKA
ncbi:MAG: pyridoxamine 5'-phosphate oxidase family protein [Candidatus Omnitrophica bacterium]|jgi:general stress protein 26|nr:pyridoxamine 5'-phosphate oxidase family protein [Candidatus Omnitrophota bacterium]